MGLSLVGEALLTVPQGRVALITMLVSLFFFQCVGFLICKEYYIGWKDAVPNAVGWELNKGRKVPRCISLAQSMDPTRFLVYFIFSSLGFIR